MTMLLLTLLLLLLLLQGAEWQQGRQQLLSMLEATLVRYCTALHGASTDTPFVMPKAHWVSVFVGRFRLVSLIHLFANKLHCSYLFMLIGRSVLTWMSAPCKGPVTAAAAAACGVLCRCAS
jgi:hypothetical protein